VDQVGPISSMEGKEKVKRERKGVRGEQEGNV
jgi:hypothetical protein